MEKAAIEYGDGLFELAEEEGAAEQIYEESRAMRRILLENPSYISLLNSRALPKEEKEEMLTRCFQGRVHPYLYNFVRLMNDRGYCAFLTGSFARYEERYLDANGYVKVRVYTAKALSDVEKSRIEQALSKKTGKKPLADYNVDPSLVGGIRVETDELLLENSVKRHLKELRAHLSVAIT